MEFCVRTRKKTELLDITSEVERTISSSGVESGACLVFVAHATAGVIINEFEPNIASDFAGSFARLFPEAEYAHNRIDGNAESHLKSGFAGPSVTIPVEGGALALGRWQKIILCEFDGPRGRRVMVKVIACK